MITARLALVNAGHPRDYYFEGHCIDGDAKTTPFLCDRLGDALNPLLAGCETGRADNLTGSGYRRDVDYRVSRQRLPGNNLSFCRYRDHRLGGPKDAERR